MSCQEDLWGVLVCGTGIGMAIAANKVSGLRAACCHNPYSAERARKSNDAQVITMGAQVIGRALARSLLDIWLESEFAGGRSVPKVEKLKALDTRWGKTEQGRKMKSLSSSISNRNIGWAGSS